MSCFACGKIEDSERATIKYYKNVHLKTGKVFYLYRKSSGSPLFVVESSYFETIFNNDIKPNFDEGAEYFSIREFTEN